MFRAWLILIGIGMLAPPARAGLYLSSEIYADLPTQWPGFLLDQRTVRQIAVPERPKIEASPWRLRYSKELSKLNGKSLSADETADQGALLLRLGNVDRAIDVLRGGQRKHPNHFAIAANLGAAWQLKGDLIASAESLRQAVRLAPGKWLAAEELHLKLVLGRLKHKQPGQELDDLFDVRYFSAASDDMAEVERKKLTPRAVGLAQQLALWLPADGPLLWQLAELANAYGDVRTAASLMEGCTQQFGMTHRDLRRRRLRLKEAVAKLPPVPLGDRAGHQNAGGLTFRSRKPLVSGLFVAALPPISATAINRVPWEVFTATAFEGRFPPKFSSYLKELNGKTITLAGYLQPLYDDDDSAFLLIESPVGCWHCEMLELTGLLYLDPAAGETIQFEDGLRRVVGRLSLNATDPDDFIFTLRDAKIARVD
jgi:hypothetical protein